MHLRAVGAFLGNVALCGPPFSHHPPPPLPVNPPPVWPGGRVRDTGDSGATRESLSSDDSLS